MSKRTSSHLSANGLFVKMVKQDEQYWNKRCKVPCKDCYLIRCGRRIDKIHAHYRKIGSEYCTGIFSGQQRNDNEEINQTMGIVSDATGNPTASCSEIDSSHNKAEVVLSRSERDLYVDVLRCCKEPTLARSERISKPKDKFRDDSERLSSYSGEIFNLHNRCHEQYQHLIKSESQRESLLQQLEMVETNSNPFYKEENFESYTDYRSWKDSERTAIQQHLENTKRSYSRGRHAGSIINRREQYKRLAEKVLTHDLRTAQKKYYTTTTMLPSPFTVNREVPSKHGRRLLAEFAERFRIVLMSRSSCHLEILAGCFEINTCDMDILLLASIDDEVKKILNMLDSCELLCLSEQASICDISNELIKRVQSFVENLLTEWIPSPRLLEITLELASNVFRLLYKLQNDNMNWSQCLSEWLHCAIKTKYHSYKDVHDKETQEMFFASVEYAVDVLKLLKRGGHGDLSYEGILNKYIPNFVQVFTRGIYESVEADETTLAKTLTSSISIQVNPEAIGADALNLRDMALSYKLAEFDSIARIDMEDLTQRPRVSWRIAYHPVAMHWLDILSCHMRRQVNEVVNVECGCYRNVTTLEMEFRDDEEGQESTSDISNSSSNLSQSQKTRIPPISKRRPRLDQNRNNNLEIAQQRVCDSCEGTCSQDCRSGSSTSTLNWPVDDSSNSSSSGEQSSRSHSSDSNSEDSSSEYDAQYASTEQRINLLPGLIMVDENCNGISRSPSNESRKCDSDGTSISALCCPKAGITTSLADFTSIMTRFIQVVKDVISTIYVLPSGTRGDDVGISEEKACLITHKNHFLLKAIEALCCGARQYITLLLQKQLGRKSAIGIFNSMIVTFNSRASQDSIFDLGKNIDQVSQHFNNLLVLQSGLPHAIHMLESFLTPTEDDHTHLSEESDFDTFMEANTVGNSIHDISSLDFQPCFGGLTVLCENLKDQLKKTLDSAIKCMGDVLIQCKVANFLSRFCHALHCLPNRKNRRGHVVEEACSLLRELLEEISRDCYEEGYSVLYKRIWKAVMQSFRLNTRLLILKGRLQCQKQCRYHLEVFGGVSNTFHRCTRQNNLTKPEEIILDLDWIRPTLNMVELLSIPTTSLISMLDNENHDVQSLVNLCMSKLRNKKSFTGSELLQAVSEVKLTATLSAPNDDMETCQHFLTVDVIRFLYHKKKVVKLPDIVNEDIADERGFSPSNSSHTWSSRQSSVNTVDTESGESTSSDFERTFVCDDKTIYRFTSKSRMFPLVCLKEHPDDSQAHCSKLHVLDVLRYKSSSDKTAKNFLRKGNPDAWTWLPCIA